MGGPRRRCTYRIAVSQLFYRAESIGLHINPLHVCSMWWRHAICALSIACRCRRNRGYMTTDLWIGNDYAVKGVPTGWFDKWMIIHLFYEIRKGCWQFPGKKWKNTICALIKRTDATGNTDRQTGSGRSVRTEKCYIINNKLSATRYAVRRASYLRVTVLENVCLFGV